MTSYHEIKRLILKFYAICYSKGYSRQQIANKIKPNITKRFKAWNMDDMTPDQLREAIKLLDDVEGNKLLVDPIL